jgi:carbamoyltransferase
MALLDNHAIVAAIEEEKVQAALQCDGVPQQALIRALDHTGVKLSDIECVGLSDCRPSSEPACMCRAVGPSHFGGLAQLLKPGLSVTAFDHHLCHTSSAFYTSEYPRALVLSLDDGDGGHSGLISLGEGDDIKPLCALHTANSLGWFYSRVTELIGFRAHRDEHKVQWLSKEGAPEFLPTFRKLFLRSAEGHPVLHRDYLVLEPCGRLTFSPKLYQELGLSKSAAPWDSATRAAIASSAQAIIEELVLELANRFGHETSTDALCLSGGIFWNVLLVRALETRSKFSSVHVQPVAGNPSTAIGAGFLARKKLSGRSGRAPFVSLALGPDFSSEHIKAVLDNCKIIYKYFSMEEQLLRESCRLLLDDKIVAWCQGPAEFGHRALGNRSILASPFSEYVIENLNHYVKHREVFHPFALSVPAERAFEFFDCGPNCHFMASLGSLANTVPGLQRFAFNGNSVRAHTVEQRANPRFWKLLHEFGRSAPAPILVNTSFNLFGEPLVTDPRGAVRSLYSAGIDALVIGSFLVIK